MNNKIEKKKEFLSYDQDGGFMFMTNWPASLRWICILPAIIFIYIVVKILFFGTVLNLLEKSSHLLSLYIGAILSGIVYMLIVDGIAAVAPKKRVLTSIIAAVIFGILVIAVSYFAMLGILNTDDLPMKTHYIIALVISFISNIVGLFMAVSITKSRQQKHQKS
ncbi:hypothetical protein [Orbus mooreae]|uniref:hypothetical protein n=1 Tax=Orbus mooreae TaxID=3074107 RepID=UPI00370DA7FD